MQHLRAVYRRESHVNYPWLVSSGISGTLTPEIRLNARYEADVAPSNVLRCWNIATYVPRSFYPECGDKCGRVLPTSTLATFQADLVTAMRQGFLSTWSLLDRRHLWKVAEPGCSVLLWALAVPWLARR